MPEAGGEFAGLLFSERADAMCCDASTTVMVVVVLLTPELFIHLSTLKPRLYLRRQYSSLESHRLSSIAPSKILVY